MFSFSTVEIDLYVGLDDKVLDAMLDIPESIAHSISTSVHAFWGASVDSDAVTKCEDSIFAQRLYLDDVHFNDALKGAMERQDLVSLQALIKAQQDAPAQVTLLKTELAALKSAKYDAFKEAWSVSRTKGKSGPRDSIEGTVVSCEVNGQTRVMKIVSHNIWRCYVRIDQGSDGTGNRYLDNDLPGANSAEFNKLSVKYASTAKRFLCAFGHASKTSRTVDKVTTVYECDGSIEDLHRAMSDKTYGKLAFGGIMGITTIADDASTWVPSNG